MDTKIIESTYSNNRLWQWCVKVGERYYGPENISFLFSEWDTDESGTPKSFAHMINAYGKSKGITEVGFGIGRTVKFIKKIEANKFRVCLRYRKIFPDKLEIRSVIDNGASEYEIPLED